MLRKFAYNKIFRTTGMLVLLVLLLLFPTSKEYSLDEQKVAKTMTKERSNEVYLLDKDNYVARCKVNISGNNDEEYAKKLIELLIMDGKYEDKVPNGFKPIFPSDMKINAINVDKNKIVIDLSKEFYEVDKNLVEKAVELLTYNLTLLDNIKELYINIDGEKLDKLPKTNKIISQPLTREDGANKEHNETNYKDVQRTTIYYVNKNNTGYYYVPVTKINNDSRDKIKIIVDELTSSNIYETNLMSFLNYNTKLNSYNLKDGVLTVDFNKYLFDDVNTSSILEEVIYSISLSIRDNYDVSEVIFTVDGKEITKSVIKNLE